MKKYKCIKGSPEVPVGTIAFFDEERDCYILQEKRLDVLEAIRFYRWQVEGNNCWEEVEEVENPTER